MASSPSRRKTGKSQDRELQVGDRVRHSKFGEGLILEVTPSGDDTRLRVSFSKEKTEKKLLANKAPLERIEEEG